jgi:ribosomal protein S18 acetylase RimI-like enzyme
MTEITPLFHLPASLLPALADLHLATMPTLLTDLGKPFVLRYYQLAQTDPSILAFCALSQLLDPESPIPDNQLPITNYELLAYCLGSPSPSTLTARLRTPLPWFATQILRLAFTRPAVLLQLAQSILSASEANTLQPGQIELTYIGVAPQARGQGLGKTILTAFVDAARIAGYKSVALSVETDNPAAIGLYTKFGFTITQTFTEGRYHRHRMEYYF